MAPGMSLVHFATPYFCRKATFDRLSFFPDAAIGLPYGAKFEVRGQQLVQIQATEESPETSTPHQEEEEEEKGCGRSNKGIVDSSSSQKLTHHEIQLMKKKGFSGQVSKRDACWRGGRRVR